MTFAQAAREVAPTGSAASFRACALEARAFARRGDRTGAEDALGRAEHALDLRAGAPTGSLFSFDAPYLPYYAGTAYRWLGDDRRALAWAGEAIELCDADPLAWPVARTSARVDAAVAYIHAGGLDTAIAMGVDAMAIWSTRPTEPAKRRIEELLVAVKPHRERSAIEFGERWRELSGQT